MSQELSTALREILSTHLGGQDIGPDDDFYAMGGDSLIALRVVADAQSRGIPFTLRDLLFNPTVRELAASLSGVPAPAEVPAAGPTPFELLEPGERVLLPDGVVDALPASALQVGIIYLCETTGDPALYHDLIGMSVEAPFDEALFRQALAELMARHPALRTSFDLGALSRPVQLVWSGVEPPLTVERLDELAVGRAEELVAAWRQRQLSRPIDWGRAPVFRCHVVALPESFHLALAIHHAVVDGWSFARLVVELLAGYDRRLAGRGVPPPAPPPTGYRDFVRLERAVRDSAEAAAFWQAEADAPALLVDRGRFGTVADPAEQVRFGVDQPLLDRLRRAAVRAGVPLKSVLLGAHAWALGQWAGRDHDVVTGLVVNGRPEVAGSDLLVGLFLNTVPMRFASVRQGFADLAGDARTAELRALPYRRYPLVQIEQRLGRPAFDVVFNFTNFHAYRELAALDAVRVAGWWTFDKNSFPVMVDFTVDAPQSGTGVVVAFDPRLVDRERADRFADLYRDALVRIGEDVR